MATFYQPVTFERDGVNMLGLNGPPALVEVIDLVRIPRIENSINITEDTIGLGWVPGLDANLTLYYHAEAALTATLSYDAGAVDIDYAMNVPQIAQTSFLNEDAVWDTSAFTFGGGQLTTHAPNLANTYLSVDFFYDFAAGVKDGFVGVGDEFGFHQGQFLPDPLELAESDDINILKVDFSGVYLLGEQLTSLPSFDFNQSGIKGFLKLPTPVPDAPGTDPATGDPIGWATTATSGNAQLPTLSRDGISASFGNIELHIFDFLASVVPILKPLELLNGRIGSSDNYLDWTVIDLYPQLNIQLTQQIRFVPTGVGVHIVTRLENGTIYQELSGALGEAFVLDTPAGEGELDVTPSYTLYGYFENDTGVQLTGRVHLTALQLSYGYDIFFDDGSGSFSFGPDVDLFKLSTDPLVFYESEQLNVPFAEIAGQTFSLQYQNFLTGGEGDDDFTITTDQIEYPIPLTIPNAGDDYVDGNALANRMSGGLDDDSLRGMGGNDTLHGGKGNDTLAGGDDHDALYGGFGNDRLVGDDGNDFLSTGEKDLVTGAVRTAGGSDTLLGGAGNDTISSLETDLPDWLDGGDDLDSLILARSGLSQAITLDAEVTATSGGAFLPDGTWVRFIEHFANVQTGFGNDTVRGGIHDDSIRGGGGNDLLVGRDGDDTLHGGAGDDVLIGGAGSDSIFGGSGKDSIFAGTGANIVNGSTGSDVVFLALDGMADDVAGNSAAEDAAGDRGVDLLVLTATSDIQLDIDITLTTQTLSEGTIISRFERLDLDATASTHDNSVAGGRYVDSIRTGSGEDTVAAGGGADLVSTGSGNDTVILTPPPLYRFGSMASASDDSQLDGGGGIDTLVIDALFGSDDGWNLTFLGGGAAQTLPEGSQIVNFERLTYLGRVTGTPADSVFGGSGDDYIFGGAGKDTLGGGAGNDTIAGGHDDDTIRVRFGEGADEIDGGSGNDRIVIDYAGAPTLLSLFVNPFGGTTLITGGTSFTDIEYITAIGSSGGDFMFGGNAEAEDTVGRLGQPVKGVADFLSGGAGDDTISGGGGRDILYGGDGDDRIYLDTGGSPVGRISVGDEIGGGAGIDTLVVDVSVVTIPVLLDAPDKLTTLADGTRITGMERIETINGEYAASGVTIGGGSGNDSISGTAHDDSLTGGDGNDTLIGNGGADVLGGDRGFDIVDYSLGAGGTVDTGGGGGGGIGLDGGGLIDTGGGFPGILFNTGVMVDLAAGVGTHGHAQGDTYTGIEGAIGTVSGDDTLIGNDDDNLLVGQGGGDSLEGGDGDDTLDGGAGGDFFDSPFGDTLSGGDGSDWASYMSRDRFGSSTATAGVTASLDNPFINTGDAALDTYVSIENLEGTAFADTLVGNADDNILEGGAGNDSLVGGLGSDTASYRNAAAAVRLDLSQTRNFTRSGEAIGDRFVSIENIDASAFNDTIAGSAGANALTGNAGNDALSGGLGNDTLLGGDGNDNLRGGDDRDLLEGGGGNDRLDGGTGIDTLRGGDGNDTYIIADNGDEIEEGERGGTDLVMSSLSHVLGAEFENLTLTGTADRTGIGNRLDNVLTGNSGNNTLEGDEGNDRIDGGIGADVMRGGRGDDTYHVDRASDEIDETLDGNDAGGNDSVVASISYTLSELLENLTLSGTALDGSGNARSNVITGNALANHLDGQGGNDRLDGRAGADSMYGGSGDDTYIVDSAGDQGIEDTLIGGGKDLVQSSASFVLGNYIENLTLTGNGNIHGTGNTLSNAIAGNTGANTLSGGFGDDTLTGGAGSDLLDGGGDNDRLHGGTGDDTMLGGGGNDTYIVDSVLDLVDEGNGIGVDQGGIDLVQSSVSFALGDFVENLTLTGGVAPINGVGNGLANTISGNSGANFLQGGGGGDVLKGSGGDDELEGGFGNDTLYGGTGSDKFVFLGFGGASGVDRIMDYVALDRIVLDTDAFTALAGNADGSLQGQLFAKGSGAWLSYQRIIYTPQTGALYYDADGSGAGVQVQFATLAPNLNLTGNSFMLA